MRHNGIMPSVKIKKEDLLKELNNNLETHLKEVEEALENRRVQLRRVFKIVIDDIDNKPDFQPINSYNYPKPDDHRDAYTKAIKMVEMSQDDVIELDDSQFDRLVMDNWEWKDNLKHTMGLYQ